ncbi:MAG: S53 family peptidase [Candidatus Sulfotelmatobacter sp.]
MRLLRERVSFFSGLLICFVAVLSLTAAVAATPDRISGPIDSGQMVSLRGNVSGLARIEFDQGPVNGSKAMSVSIAFKPSLAQQAELDQLLADQQNPSSSSYHKWLTPVQFGERFGMSDADLAKVTEWLQSQGLTVTGVANGRNQMFFQGTATQIGAAFHTQIHNYLVDGEMHWANATEPSVPAALEDVVLGFQNLHNFNPKPRARFHKVESHFTSALSGNHFLSPGDFATIYDVKGLYSAGMTGSGQSIAIIGQTTVNASDLSNFRSAAGLSAKAATMTLVPSTGTGTRCSGDEGESDLDLEWSGGVAQNAQIIFVYVGLLSGETCTNRTNSVWNSLQYAIDHNLAPVVSTSYGYCESGLGQTFADEVQGWVQQGKSQGQTVIAASGDSGAADCDPNNSDPNGTSATGGLAVDIPAAIPEVTGAGGTEFFGDNTTGADAPYWAGTTGTTDDISSALEHIPEEGWNDTTLALANGGGLSASGGGASIYFSKPAWQTGTDGKRDVPDIAVNASPDHDGYLFCSEDGPNNTIVATCTSGFRDSSTDLDVVGGTSAAAPTFAAIIALINQDLGNVPPAGLGEINPTLYALAASNPTAFHDVTTGNNIVPCTQGSTSCPASAPFQFGFSAGTGYDQVAGLGSVDALVLAQAWAGSLPSFALSSAPGTISVSAGQNSSPITVTVSPATGFTGTVTFSCSGLPTGATCSFAPASSGTSTTLTIQTLPTTAGGSSTVTVTGTSGAVSKTASVALTVTATTETFTIAPSTGSFSVTAGTAASVPITVSSTTGFTSTSGGNTTTVVPLTYSCTGLPLEANCNFSPAVTSSSTSITLSVTTTAPTARLQRPNEHNSRILFAALLPGLFGMIFMAVSWKGSGRGAMRMLTLVVALGFSTLWLSSCGGSTSSSNSNPGTPAGSSTVTVSATTGGANPITNSFKFTLVVSQ